MANIKLTYDELILIRESVEKANLDPLLTPFISTMLQQVEYDARRTDTNSVIIIMGAKNKDGVSYV